MSGACTRQEANDCSAGNHVATDAARLGKYQPSFGVVIPFLCTDGSNQLRVLSPLQVFQVPEAQNVFWYAWDRPTCSILTNASDRLVPAPSHAWFQSNPTSSFLKPGDTH